MKGSENVPSVPALSLKHAVGMVGAYATGKAYEEAYKKAEIAILIYLDKHYAVGTEFCTCLWSYLLCIQPTSQEILDFREEHEAIIEGEALEFIELEGNEPFKQLVVSTLWVALCVCRAHEDKAGFDRILASKVFRRYSTVYPMPSRQDYSTLAETWFTAYR